MQHERKLIRREHQQLSETRSQAQAAQSAREFVTPEEMLQFDAKQTAVPGGIAERLNRSLANEPPAPRRWWKRWLG